VGENHADLTKMESIPLAVSLLVDVVIPQEGNCEEGIVTDCFEFPTLEG
jgi:hypothetical protein